MACNARNPQPGNVGVLVGCGNSCNTVAIATVFNNANQHINVYGDDIEVDYRGYEVKGHHHSRLFSDAPLYR